MRASATHACVIGTVLLSQQCSPGDDGVCRRGPASLLAHGCPFQYSGALIVRLLATAVMGRYIRRRMRAPAQRKRGSRMWEVSKVGSAK